MQTRPDPPLGFDRAAPPPDAGTRALREGDSLFLPRGRAAKPTGSTEIRTLPPHLQELLPQRLRNAALLYSLAYFLSDLAPDILRGQLRQSFRTPADWVPTVASILIGLAVAVIASSPHCYLLGALAALASAAMTLASGVLNGK